MTNALIFGANGQDGYYLARLLEEKDVSVVGISRGGNWLHANIGDFYEVSAIIKQYKPAYIFHLAANSTTRHEAIFENHVTISSGTLNILEAVKLYSPDSKVFLSGSGLQFKNMGSPIKESDPFEATSAYAVSRIQSVYAARYYRSMGIKAYVGYFFNHESPLRPERHMSKKIACLAKRVASGSNEQIDIGDISVKKEWAFAGDIVNAVWTLMQQDSVLESTIGSGLAYSIEDWLNECFGIIGKEWRSHITQPVSFKAEYEVLVSNPATLFSLGWKPQVSFSSLAKMMVTEP